MEQKILTWYGHLRKTKEEGKTEKLVREWKPGENLEETD